MANEAIAIDLQELAWQIHDSANFLQRRGITFFPVPNGEGSDTTTEAQITLFQDLTDENQTRRVEVALGTPPRDVIHLEFGENGLWKATAPDQVENFGMAVWTEFADANQHGMIPIATGLLQHVLKFVED